MNVLITGANGFMGSNISTLLQLHNKNINVIRATRETTHLIDINKTYNFIKKNEINAVIHTAHSGCDDKYSKEYLHNNLQMFENLIGLRGYFETFINIGSGTEKPVYDHEIRRQLPPEIPYNFSKYIISKRLEQIYNEPNGDNIHNLVLYNCFYKINDRNNRMIKSNILNYINNQPIIINKDMFVDFFYLEDMIQILHDILYKSYILRNTVDIVYDKKYKLTDVANIINSLGNHKSEIILKSKELGESYIGNSYPLCLKNYKFIGVEQGIKNCYEHYLSNPLPK